MMRATTLSRFGTGSPTTRAARSAIAGSTKLGRFVTLAAKALVLGHLRVGDGVQVGARSMVTRDVSDGERVTGSPAFEHRAWRRAALAFKDLPDTLARLRRLERRQKDGHADGGS